MIWPTGMGGCDWKTSFFMLSHASHPPPQNRLPVGRRLCSGVQAPDGHWVDECVGMGVWIHPDKQSRGVDRWSLVTQLKNGLGGTR